jgi:hypothetical protein
MVEEHRALLMRGRGRIALCSFRRILGGVHEPAVRKSGGSSPTMLMKSTRSRQALAIRRDE